MAQPDDQPNDLEENTCYTLGRDPANVLEKVNQCVLVCQDEDVYSMISALNAGGLNDPMFYDLLAQKCE